MIFIGEKMRLVGTLVMSICCQHQRAPYMPPHADAAAVRVVTQYAAGKCVDRLGNYPIY